MSTPFILSNETINSYGFWVVTKGIDLSVFKANPVMLYDHRSYSMLPLGIWNNITKDDQANLTAEPEFDTDDEQATAIMKKVDKGYLRGASIGIDIIETSDEPKLSKPGQRRPTVTKCVIFEASITPLPSNTTALKLRYKGETISLNAETTDEDIDKILPRLPLKKEIDNPKNEKSMERIALKLGLAKDATEEQILAKMSENETAAAELAVKQLVKLGREIGTVTDANVKTVERLAKADYELASEMYLKKVEDETEEKEASTEAGTKKETLIKDLVNKGSKPEKVEKKFEELSAAEIETIRDKDRPAYAKLYKTRYGVEPTFE